ARERFPGEQGRVAAPEAGDPILSANAKATASLYRTEDDDRHKRFVAIREEFAKLADDEQLDWVRRVREDAESATATSPGIMRRLSRGEWQSPLVQAMVVNFYAKREYGTDWARLPLTAFAPEEAEVR